MGDLLKLLFIGAFIALMVVLAPWLLIWAVNTLVASAMVGAPAGTFVPQIVFGFWTWLAALWLLMAVFGSKSK